MPQSTASPAADQYGRNSKLSGREEETVLKEQGPSGFWWMTSEKHHGPVPTAVQGHVQSSSATVPTPLHKAEKEETRLTSWPHHVGVSSCTSLPGQKEGIIHSQPQHYRDLRRGRGTWNNHLQTTIKVLLKSKAPSSHLDLFTQHKSTLSPGLLPESSQ